MTLIVVFVTSIYTLSLNGTFQTFQIECLCYPYHYKVFTTKLKNILVKAVLWKKNTTRIDRKIVELECPIKEKKDRIALNKGPTISPTRKGGSKKQSPRVLQFLMRVTRVLMCQTSMCALVLLFWIPYQRKGGPNCSEQGSYNFSPKKSRAEEAKS